MDKRKQGFALLSPDARREIARRGGMASQSAGTRHRFTSEEARQAGRLGGASISQDREHMAEIGRRGAAARRARLASRGSADETVAPPNIAAQARTNPPAADSVVGFSGAPSAPLLAVERPACDVNDMGSALEVRAGPDVPPLRGASRVR